MRWAARKWHEVPGRQTEAVAGDKCNGGQPAIRHALYSVESPKSPTAHAPRLVRPHVLRGKGRATVVVDRAALADAPPPEPCSFHKRQKTRNPPFLERVGLPVLIRKYQDLPTRSARVEAGDLSAAGVIRLRLARASGTGSEPAITGLLNAEKCLYGERPAAAGFRAGRFGRLSPTLARTRTRAGARVGVRDTRPERPAAEPGRMMDRTYLLNVLGGAPAGGRGGGTLGTPFSDSVTRVDTPCRRERFHPRA
jgi:hypothetical protein